MECNIVRNNQASSHVHNEVNTHHAAFEVKNNVSIAFFSDPNFMHELPGNPVHVHVGDQVFVKVFTTMVEWSIKMRLHSCFTQSFLSADESSKYYLIKDGYVEYLSEVRLKYVHLLSKVSFILVLIFYTVDSYAVQTFSYIERFTYLSSQINN